MNALVIFFFRFFLKLLLDRASIENVATLRLIFCSFSSDHRSDIETALGQASAISDNWLNSRYDFHPLDEG